MSEHQKDPLFWSKFDQAKQQSVAPPPRRTTKMTPEPPKKNPALLHKLQEQQRKQQAIVINSESSISISSSESSGSSSEDVDVDDDNNDMDVVPTGALSVLSLSSSGDASVKRPRFVEPPQSRSDELKRLIEATLAARRRMRLRRDELEGAEADLQQRRQDFGQALNAFRQQRPAQPPRLLCTESPLLAAAAQPLNGQAETLLRTRPFASSEQLAHLLAHYDTQLIFMQMAQGRLRLLSGFLDVGADASTSYAFVVALRPPENEKTSSDTAPVVFYNIHRV